MMEDEKDKSFDEQQWSSLLDDWQAQPTKEIDTQALLRRIKRRSWVIWLHSALDVVTIAGSWIFGLYLLFFSDKGPEFAYLIFSIALLGTIIMVIEMQMRKGTWHHHGEGNDSVLDFSVRRCEVAIKVGRLFFPAMLALTAVILTWQGFVYVLMDILYVKLVGGSIAGGLLVVIASRVYIRRKQKELNKLKALL